jgi:heme A synthase
MENKVERTLGGIVAIMIIVYAILAFIAGNINPLEWWILGRLAYIVICGAVIGFMLERLYGE